MQRRHSRWCFQRRYLCNKTISYREYSDQESVNPTFHYIKLSWSATVLTQFLQSVYLNQKSSFRHVPVGSWCRQRMHEWHSLELQFIGVLPSLELAGIDTCTSHCASYTYVLDEDLNHEKISIVNRLLPMWYHRSKLCNLDKIEGKQSDALCKYPTVHKKSSARMAH